MQQAGEDIAAYAVATLLDEYHHGSRAWLYDEFAAWLNGQAPPPTADEGGADGAGDRTTKLNGGGASGGGGDGAASRMFLLLAGPGMGKSVFSAVMHTKLAVLANKRAELVLVRAAARG